MREIKFRAWDIDRKEYHYPELWDNSMPSNWKEYYVLEQYTGIKIKNGVEIYEGDKVEWSDESIMDVTWIEKEGCWGLDNVLWLANCNWKNHIRVIGNIHEEK